MKRVQIIQISVGEEGVVLHTPGGTVHARTIVLATNAWLPELGTLVGANWLSSCIIPTRGQILAPQSQFTNNFFPRVHVQQMKDTSTGGNFLMDDW